MKLQFLSVFLQLPGNAPEMLDYSAYMADGSENVELSEPVVPLGLAVEAGLLKMGSSDFTLGLASDVGYYTTDKVWPYRAVVDRTALDVGWRWDTCRMGTPAGGCFWWDVMIGPRMWVYAPTDWAGGLNYGFGARSGIGLTFLEGKVRPSVGGEISTDLAWGSRSGTLELPEMSGYWSYSPGGFHADLRVGVEL